MDGNRRQRRFCFAGVLLLLLGLLTGAVIPLLENPRMGVAAHTTGVQGGLMLLVFALLWDKLRLGPGVSRFTGRLLIGSAYLLWLALLASAALGTSRSTPIAGSGHAGTPFEEQLVSVGLLGSSLAIVVATVFVLVGLRGRALRS